LASPPNFWVLPGPPCMAGIARGRSAARRRIFSSLTPVQVNRSAAQTLKSHRAPGVLWRAAVNALSQSAVRLTPRLSFSERRCGAPTAIEGAG
jgi:hypothetical protein